MPNEDPKNLINKLNSEYSDAEDYLSRVRDNSDFNWEQKEKVASGLLASMSENKFKSKVNSNALMNLVIDQASRVMAQLPTGKVKAISKSDAGKSYLMQCVLEKYILPKANTQWDMLTKFRIIEMYSLIYGSMPALVTYKVSSNYVGPDLEEFGIPSDSVIHLNPKAREILLKLNELINKPDQYLLELAENQMKSFSEFAYEWDNYHVLSEMANRIGKLLL